MRASTQDADDKEHTMDKHRKPRLWARLMVAGVAGLSLVGALGTTALAQTDSNGSNDSTSQQEGRPHHPQLTDEQRSCIESKGVDLPDRSEADNQNGDNQNADDQSGDDQGTERQRPTDAQ